MQGNTNVKYEELGQVSVPLYFHSPICAYGEYWDKFIHYFETITSKTNKKVNVKLMFLHTALRRKGNGSVASFTTNIGKRENLKYEFCYNYVSATFSTY
jgi:hypothetical protein